MTDIASDGRGGFFVCEPSGVPRRTAHVAADGRVLREWFGPCGFLTRASPDPADPADVWYRPEDGHLVLARVDYDTGRWRVCETHTLANAPGAALAPAGLRGVYTPVAARRWGDRRVLVFQWADRDGDGVAQAGELTFLSEPPARGPKVQAPAGGGELLGADTLDPVGDAPRLRLRRVPENDAPPRPAVAMAMPPRSYFQASALAADGAAVGCGPNRPEASFPTDRLGRVCLAASALAARFASASVGTPRAMPTTPSAPARPATSTSRPGSPASWSLGTPGRASNRPSDWKSASARRRGGRWGSCPRRPPAGRARSSSNWPSG